MPFRIHLFLGLGGETEKLPWKISGFPESWIGVTVSALPYESDPAREVERASAVYLTADSQNVVEDLTSNASFIIGGIVDRNRYKNASLDKAKLHDLKHARLPLQRYCTMNTSKVLAINHVFDILLARRSSRDWPTAF